LAAAQIECFAAGTRIRTTKGLVAVEDLREAMIVPTHVSGETMPIVWIGSRTLDCARHPRPETVWPVRVAVGAFGPGLPSRALFLSPDHAVFVNGVLVPVKLLINGSTIVQVKRKSVTYFHVELPRHDVVLAEGLPVESYLDVGDRPNFAGQSGGVTRLFPDFAAQRMPNAALAWESMACAALVMSGGRLRAIRREISRRAGQREPDRGATSL
jgi:Hint domain